MKGPLFYAKILLFGEYGIIKDSKGLAIPFNAFKGALKNEDVQSEVALESNSHLKKFASYLKKPALKKVKLLLPLILSSCSRISTKECISTVLFQGDTALEVAELS